MRRLALAVVALLFVICAPALIVSLFLSAGDASEPSDRALEEIPSELLPVYRAAGATCEGLDWTVLAAIHKVETGFGLGAATSSAGAQGPMQFMPATFASYAVDGSGDGRVVIDDPMDAIFSAANLLCANGAGDPERLPRAIWNYNHSQAYVDRVLQLATSYGTWGSGQLGGSVGLSAQADADLRAGRVDRRVLEVLRILSVRYELEVSVFKSGHSKYTRNGSVSNHWYGRAADISEVGGSPVSASNPAAYRFVADVLTLPPHIRPTEIGHPFLVLLSLGGFSDADHRDHIHLGFD